MDGLLVNGKFYPGRTCVSKFGTRSPVLLKDKRPEWDILPHFDEGKHLYWKALDKNGLKKAQEYGLEAHPYPKPWMNLDGIE